jgi:segregation and condensation protein B
VLKQLLDELIASSAADNRGVEIREIAGGYRMATKPECHDAVRMFVKSLKPAMKLSLPALETLAVVAYKQPVTAPEVNEIRGVESAGVLGSLLARKLIATAGRKPVIGRPILYKTTKEFLLRFGLKDVSELPSMEEFEKMAAMELEESGPSGDGSEATNVEEAGAEEAGAVDSDEQMLEFNSPSGEELGESLEGPQSGAEAQTHEAAAAPSKSESDGGAIAVSAAGADQAPHSVSPNQTQKAAPAKPEDSEQAETGAVPDAQEDKRDG